MTGRVVEVPEGRWPSGDSRALMTVSPPLQEVASRLGISPRYGVDELGEYAASAFRSESGIHFGVLHYISGPERGTTIYVDAGQDLVAAFVELFASTDLSPSEVTWVNPEAESASPPVQGVGDSD